MTRQQVGFNEAGLRVGETHHRAKLSDEDVQLVLELREPTLDEKGRVVRPGLSYRAIARKFDNIKGGIHYNTIRRICLGETRAQEPAVFRPAHLRR